MNLFRDRPQRVTRAVVCSDFLMTSDTEQQSNLRWLKDLLRRPLRSATGFELEAFSSGSGSLDRERFFSLSGLPLDAAATHAWYDVESITPASRGYLQEFIERDTLVVGYELSRQTRQLLTQMGVVYIDAWLHPVRFLDDVLFAFGSNSPAVREALRAFHVSRELCFLYADRLRIQAYKGFSRPNANIDEGSALFVGQTLNDKSVLHKGRFLTLLDFKERFAALAEEAQTVYYARHPFVKTGDEEIMDFVRGFANVEQLAVPSYIALAHPNIDRVATISSSVGVEAAFFDKKSEFFHEPVIETDPDKPDGYAGVLQDFASPHFWSAILGAHCSTDASAPRLEFTDRKDKLRDMLAFYWSYKSIDKVEAMRSTLTGVNSKVNDLAKSRASAGASSNPAPRIVEREPGPLFSEIRHRFMAELADVDAVSFDLFDTLCLRAVWSHEDVVELIDVARIARRAGVAIDKAQLQAARKRARARHIERFGPAGEVTLIERYREVVDELGLPGSLAETLAHEEERVDLSLLHGLKSGLELLRAAQEAGKRVVVVSDTYYEAPFIRRLLDKIGLNGVRAEDVILSSAHRKTKMTGELFAEVAAHAGVAPGRILHVGDNADSDVAKAAAAGLRALHLPGLRELAGRGAWPAMSCSPPSLACSVANALAASRQYQLASAISYQSFAAGVPNRLGFMVFGPLLYAFSHWILRRSAERGVDRLLFLARDGQIAMRGCEQLAGGFDNAPRFEYTLASRRALGLATCENLADVHELLARSFSPSTIGELVSARLGLDPGAEGVAAALGACGFDSADTKVRHGRAGDMERVHALAARLEDRILSEAEKERRLLVRHYTDALGDAQAPAIVDIGHHGTMQQKLVKLLGRPFGGFYFATYSDIDRNVALPNWHESFFVDRGDPKADDDYNRFILMFEFLFLNAEGSFQRFVETDAGVVPEFTPAAGDEERRRFIAEVHEGAESFCQRMASILKSHLPSAQLPAAVAAGPLLAMLRAPGPADARLFDGLAFENRFSGRSHRYVIAPEGAEAGALSVWKEGQAVLHGTD